MLKGSTLRMLEGDLSVSLCLILVVVGLFNHTFLIVNHFQLRKFMICCMAISNGNKIVRAYSYVKSLGFCGMPNSNSLR